MKKLMKSVRGAACAGLRLLLAQSVLGAGLAFGEPVAIDVDALGEVSFERDGYRFDSETRLVTLLEDRQFILRGNSTAIGVFVRKNVKNVTLNALKIENKVSEERAHPGTPISLEDGAEVVFTLENKNTLVAAPHCAAIEVPRTAKLTIVAEDDEVPLKVCGGRKNWNSENADLPEGNDDEGDSGKRRTEGGAGIGTGANPRADCGTIIICGGAIEASGGERAAGIGGGDAGGCAGNIEIRGGKITATGGWGAAGIGSGYGQGDNLTDLPSCDGRIVISGGRVTATGGDAGAGIGGGGYWDVPNKQKGPDVQILGGTVSAEGGEGVELGPRWERRTVWPWDFGAGSNPDKNRLPVVVVSGGTVWAAHNDRCFNQSPRQSEGGAKVSPVRVELGEAAAQAKVEVRGLPPTFGVQDIYANGDGNLRFYFPVGLKVSFIVTFTEAGGDTPVTKHFWAVAADVETKANEWEGYGLFINDESVEQLGSGTGWRRDGSNVRLDGTVERYVLTGYDEGKMISVENIDSTKVLELKDICLECDYSQQRGGYLLFQDACRGKSVRLEINGVASLRGYRDAICLCDGIFCEIDAAAGASEAVLVLGVDGPYNEGGDPLGVPGTCAVSGDELFRSGRRPVPRGTVALRGGFLYAEGCGVDGEKDGYSYVCAGLYAQTNIVSGGTLHVLAGKKGMAQNPPSPSLRASVANIFTGGSILAGDGKMSTEAAIRVAPTNGAGKAVHRVTVPVSGGTDDDSRVKISGIPDYGCKDIVALNGKAYLYLPDGDYLFTVNGRFVRATVNGADTEATDELGFTVNGTDVMSGPGEGWAYNVDAGVLMISGNGTYVLSGEAMFDEVQVNVAGSQNPTVILSNAVIFTEGRPALNVATGATLTLADGQVMMAGDAPESMRYASDWTEKRSILVGPGATVTVKDGIPHVTDVVVSNRTGTVSWTAVEGGKAYRVLLGDDIFVGYTVEKGYFPRAENPLRYAAIGGDVTVDAKTIPTAADLPYRAWNPTTRRMEDRTCSGYEVVTANTATFENGKWYAVTNTVNRGMITVNGAAHLILCDGVRLTANGGKNQAGIAVVSGNSLAIYGQALGTGELVAQGGDRSAGIGGRNRLNTSCGAVTIDGGRVTARGGFRAAGIGSGNKGAGGTVTINGGQVWAQGDRDSADIGGGYRGGGGVVTINGGTVTAAGASTSIGGGKKRRRDCRLTIDGGSVKANIARGLAKNSTPTNVYCVTVKCPFASASTADRPLVLEGLGNYGTNDIYVVEEKVCLRLPNGTYHFTLSDGSTTHRYFAVVKGIDITVEPLPPVGAVGFFVNGTDIGTRAGTDWTYGGDRVLSLNGNGTYVLSGEGTNNVVQVKVTQPGATVILSNAVVFTEGRPALDVAQSAALQMAGGASFVGTTNNASAVSIAQGAALVVDLAPGANRLETMIGVFNYDAAAAVAGQGSAKVNGGTFFVWADGRAVETPVNFTYGMGELMQTGKTPEAMMYAETCSTNPCVLVGPAVTVMVKDIPHVTDVVVSNRIEAIAHATTVGGTVYRVMLGDDVFVGYALEEGYVTDADNPLAYASIENDVTVDETVIPAVRGIPFRDWNAETRQMEDWICADYTVVTADTATFEDDQWYVVTNTVSRGTITVSGAAHLILCDGAKLAVTGGANGAGLAVTNGNALTIYGQSLGSGELVAKGDGAAAGIGSNSGAKGGAVTLNGGLVTATGGKYAAGIGGGNAGDGGVITINGGTVTAAGDRMLPVGYTEVEYIESTPDGGQYVNTGYTPNKDTKVVCRLLDRGTDSHRQFGAAFGTREGYSRKRCLHLWLRHFNENRPSYGRAGAESWSVKSTFPFGEITTVTCQGPTCSWVNDAGTKENGITLTTDYDVNQEKCLAPLTIFAINSTTAEGGCTPLEFWGFRLYSFQIYEGATLVHDFVPCVEGATGKAGLYDIVERRFHGNDGNGQFAHSEVTIADAADIGGGRTGADATVTINGGSVKAETVRSAPTNGTGAPVYCVKTKCEGIGDRGSGIGLEGLEGYGTDGIRPVDGWVYLWLPNGTHRFALSGGQTTNRYCAVVDGKGVTVEPLGPIGFFADGVDIGVDGIGDGWHYQERVLTLGGAKAYVLSGEATNDEVQVNVAANGATAVLSNAFVFASGRPAVEIAQGAALAIGAGQVMLAGELPETLRYATTCGVARCVRVVPGATVTVKDIPHVSNVVVSNLTGTVPGVPVAGGTAYRVMFGDSIFVGYAVEAGYVSDAENPLRYLPIEGDVMVDKELEGRIWKPTGVTVDGKDIGCREWTADGSDCHFDTNSWTLSFNLSERFLLEGSNRTDRAISMFLATNGLSVAFTNLAIGSTVETVYPIGTGSDPACWGFFTNTANAVVKVGEGVYAFDPADRMLPGLTSGRIAPNRWFVAPAGSFKARATVDGVTYRFRTLGEALAVAGRGGEIELEADISGERLSVPSDAFFTLDGNGHVITPLAAGDSAALVAVASNCFVCVLNVAFDGNGISNALASVESFGALALVNCVVRGFRVPEGALIAVDSSKGSSAPAVALSGLVTSNNVARGGVGAVAGTSILSADALADAVVLAEGAEIAFTNVAPTARIVLDPINAANRIGATLVRAITGGVALDPAKVGISAPDYVAVGDGKGGIVLDYAANNYVARIGGTAYLSLSAAFAAANNGSTIEAIALTNRAQRTCRDTVSASGICTVGKDRRVGLGSVLCEVDGSGHLSPIPASGVRTTVDWSAPGAKLVIDKDAVLAPGNVAFRGPLTLDGEGLLDLAAYAGTITVRPQRKGRIAVNATGKLQLAGGMAGELYVNSSGEAFYRVGSFTAEFKETGNGVGMIVIDDYGENVTIQVSNPVMDGSFTYRYKSAVTGENRDLTFGVLYLDTSCDTFALPPETSGANPKYRAKGDADKPLTTIELPNDIQVGAGGTITLKNYNSTFTISGIEPITKEELEKRWEEILRRFFDDEKEGKDWLEFLKYLPEDLRDQLLDILDAAFMAALEVLDKSWAEILGTVRKVLATLKGVASVTRRLVCSLYVNEGDKDDDYYLAFNAEQAFNRAIEEDLTVHYTRDALTPAYVVDDGSVLTIDLKGAVNVDASSIACWAKLPGHAKKFDEIFLQNLINKVVQKVAAAIIKAGGYAAQIGMAKPHASAQDGQGPWLTVEDGATLEIKNLLSRDWMRKDVPIGPTGTILLIKDDGTLKIEDSLITNYNMQVGCAVEVEEGGSLKIGANVLIRDNVKNVCVSSSESITVEDGTSQIGISGLTEDGQAFAMTNGEELDWNSIFLNDRYPGDTRYSAKADGDLVKWIYAVPTPGIPSFPRPGDEARTGGHAFDIRMITERDGAGNVTTFARIWGAPTNGVKGAWYYLKATEALGKEFGYLPDFKWQAAEDGPVVEMQKGPEGSCCDVPAPSTVTNRFFRIGAQSTDPAAR